MDDPTIIFSFPHIGKFEYNEGTTIINTPGETITGTHELLQ